MPAGKTSAADAFRARFTELGSFPVRLSLGAFAAQGLYWGFYPRKWWRNYLHAHSFYEVCYAWGGNGTFRIKGRDLAVKAGDVFVAKPAEEHEIISSRARPMGIYFWAFTLVRRGGGSAGDETELLEALERSTRWLGRKPEMQQTIDLLTAEIAAREAGCAAAVAALATKLVLDSARAVSEVAAMPELQSSDGVEAVAARAARFARDNFARPISVSDIAAEVGLSSRQLNRCFRRVFASGVLNHLTEIRLSAARQLLLDRQLGVKQVAAAVGYPDVRYFTTLFHRRSGVTPAAFRAVGGTRFMSDLQTRASEDSPGRRRRRG